MQVWTKALATPLVIATALYALPVRAVPIQVPYSGQLAEAGELVTGPRDLNFKLCRNTACAGADKVYEQTIAAVQVSNGAFSVQIGSDNLLDSTAFKNSGLLLKVTVGTTVLGDVALPFAPYAADTPDAVLLDGSRAMTGALNLAGKNIINVATIQADNVAVAGLAVTDVSSADDVTVALDIDGTDANATFSIVHGLTSSLLLTLDEAGLTTLEGSLNTKGNVTLGDAAADTITVTGAPTFAETATFNGAVAANGNVTLGNAAADTITFTGVAASALNLNNNVINNIGNAGTDFGATGGLTLANALTVSAGGAAVTGNSSVAGTFGQTGGGQVTLSGNVDAQNGLDVTTAPLTFNNAMTQTGAGQVTFTGNVDAASGVDVTGNITVSGSVDSVDVSTHNHSGAGQGGTVPHANLSGLANDDHTQYLELDGSDTMTGNLQLGANNVVTTGTVDGVDVSGHNHSGAGQGGTVAHGSISGSATGDDHTQYLELDGSDTMTGSLQMGANSITGSTAAINFNNFDVLGTGAVTAVSFAGNGAGLTSLTGANVTGTVPNATTAVNFSGNLAGDVTGPQGTTAIAADVVDGTELADTVVVDGSALTLQLNANDFVVSDTSATDIFRLENKQGTPDAASIFVVDSAAAGAADLTITTSDGDVQVGVPSGNNVTLNVNSTAQLVVDATTINALDNNISTSGTFTGNGSGLTNLADTGLSANVAHLNVAETITADWVNTANPWLDTEVADTLTIGGSSTVADAALSANVAHVNAIETITANWVNTASPWLDNEVADSLTIGAGSTVADSTLSASVANLDVAETITANWVNTANPWLDAEVADTLTIGASSTVADGALSSNVVLKNAAAIITANYTLTSATASPLLIKPSAAPTANTRMFDMQATGVGTSNFFVDSEGDATGTSFTGSGSGLTNISDSALSTNVAHLNVAETITADWVNTANPWLDTEVADTLTIGGSSTVADAALSANVAHVNVAETITANWVNTANPWLDAEVADTLTIGASSTVADGALSATVANLDVTETIAANWVNTANPWADNEVADDLTISGGTVNGTPIGGTTRDAGSFTGITVGSGATGTQITGHLSGTATNLVTASIGATACADYGAITVTGAAVGDTVYASPDASDIAGIEEANLMWNVLVTATNTVTIRACNPTGYAIDTADNQEWRADVWKH